MFVFLNTWCITKMKLALIFFIGAISYTSASKCEIAVRGQLSDKPPILFTVTNGKWKLAQPTKRQDFNSFFDLSDQTIGLACPGDKNFLNVKGKQLGHEVTGTCSSERGIIFNINGVEYDALNLLCNEKASAVEQVTNKLCSKQGVEVKLGFMVKNEMHELITSCHKIIDGTTYFSKHILQGGQFPLKYFKGKPGDRSVFHYHDKKLYQGFPPYMAYKDGNQIASLSNSLGQNVQNNGFYGKDQDKFFSKGHLAPNADFVVDSWKDATFLFVNTQPQWQQINGYNWNEVEKAVRKIASKKSLELEVITGTEGILKPELGNKRYGQPLYLGKRQTHPVPAYFWKVVRNTKTNECIGFISNNFPLHDQPVAKCNDICSQNNWPKWERTMIDGNVNCCSYSDMKKIFEIPNMQCSQILKNA